MHIRKCLSETHTDLDTLQQHLEQLQVTYLNDQPAIFTQEQTDEIDDTDDTNETPEQTHITDETTSETVFTPEQISKFRQIYLKKVIENDDEYDNEKQEIKKVLEKLDEDALRHKLQTLECCKEEHCLQKNQS